MFLSSTRLAPLRRGTARTAPRSRLSRPTTRTRTCRHGLPCRRHRLRVLFTPSPRLHSVVYWYTKTTQGPIVYSHLFTPTPPRLHSVLVHKNNPWARLFIYSHHHHVYMVYWYTKTNNPGAHSLFTHAAPTVQDAASTRLFGLRGSPHPCKRKKQKNQKKRKPPLSMTDFGRALPQFKPQDV